MIRILPKNPKIQKKIQKIQKIKNQKKSKKSTNPKNSKIQGAKRWPEGSKGGLKGPKEAWRAKEGPKGLRQEVGAWRAPELLVVNNVNILNILKIVNTVSETPGFLRSHNILRSKNFLRCQHCQGAVKRHNAKKTKFQKGIKDNKDMMTRGQKTKMKNRLILCCLYYIIFT